MAVNQPGDLCSCRPWEVQPECCCPDWPQPWPVPCDVPPEELTVEQRRALWAQAAASERLHRLTAFRWGLCEDLVRPCGPMSCQPQVSFGGLYGSLYGPGVPVPYVSGGQMFNCVCGCGCRDCEVRCTIPLPGPVNQVLEVTIDGEPLVEFEDWALNSEGGLVRLNGCWPHEQDMTVPCGADGSFCVRYLRGINPSGDLGAIQAVSALACKLFHDACGDAGGCPNFSNATRISRGGVTWDRDPERVSTSFTGVGVVDDWIDLVNPTRALQVPRVYSPDTRKWKFRGVAEFDRAAAARRDGRV